MSSLWWWLHDYIHLLRLIELYAVHVKNFFLLYTGVCACMLSCFNGVRFFVTLWTVAHEASPGKIIGMGCHAFLQGFFPGIEPLSLTALIGGFFTPSATWEAHIGNSYWSRVDNNVVSFKYTAKWFSYTYTCIYFLSNSLPT